MTAPGCPRCGYDQSGLIATWREACPLLGVCSECGVEFEWTHVLGPRVRGPAWSVEHGQRLRFGRWARAGIRALRPARLWREFRLDYPITTGRLLVMIGSWLAIWHVVAALIVGVPNLINVLTGGWLTYPWWRVAVVPYVLSIVVPRGAAGTLHIPVSPCYVIMLVPLAVLPLVTMVFGETMGRVSVRPVHILRGLAYALPAFAIGTVLMIGGIVALGPLSRVLENLFPASRPVVLVIGLAIVLAWPVWLLRYWHLFLRRYLRLPRARWITLSLAIIMVLCMALSLLGLALSDARL